MKQIPQESSALLEREEHELQRDEMTARDLTGFPQTATWPPCWERLCMAPTGRSSASPPLRSLPLRSTFREMQGDEKKDQLEIALTFGNYGLGIQLFSNQFFLPLVLEPMSFSSAQKELK